MKQVFDPTWRTQNRSKRKFYAKYMRWLEVIGYTVVALVLGSFIVAFNYRVDDLVTADKVKVVANGHLVNAEQPTLVVAELVESDEDVAAGKALLQVVEGADAIERYKAWRAVQEVIEAAGKSAETNALLVRYPKPPTKVLIAPAKGKYLPAADYYTTSKGVPVEEGKEIFRIVDYNDLRLEASLAGQTVAAAKPGQMAQLTSIAIDPQNGALLRGSGEGGAFLSGSIIGPDLKTELNNALAGKPVKVRDDIPLKISEVSEVQVDTIVDQKSTHGEGGIQLDPTQRYTVPARVLSGEPSGVIQLADLPPDLAQKAAEIVRKSVDGKAALTPDGKSVDLSKARDIGFVIKAKAVKGDTLENALSGTPLTRTFDAKLKIDHPPAFLINAVREADRLGTNVTARVELRTGSRPIAFILLRKS